MTPEEHQWLAAIHHQSTVLVPAQHEAIHEKLKAIADVLAHLHHHVHAQLPEEHQNLQDAIAAIGTVSGPTADAIAAKLAHDLAERLLE